METNEIKYLIMTFWTILLIYAPSMFAVEGKQIYRLTHKGIKKGAIEDMRNIHGSMTTDCQLPIAIHA